MFSNQKSPFLSTLALSTAVSITTIFAYHSFKHRIPSVRENHLQELEKNIVSLMKTKPEVFLNGMNEAAQLQQEKIRTEMEDQATGLKDKLLSNSIKFGPQVDKPVQFIAFIDPMCPHCNEYQKIAYFILKNRQDVNFHMIPLAVLGPNSEAMAKFMIAAAKQSSDKLKSFQEKFIENIADMNRQKLLELAKTNGFDIAALEKEEQSNVANSVLAQNTQYAEQIKIGGVPTVYVIDKEGKMKIVPPMSVEGFIELIDHVKGVSSSSTESSSTATKEKKEVENKPLEKEKESVEKPGSSSEKNNSVNSPASIDGSKKTQ